ncbi:MAG: signal peptidase I [Oscillospiraceae bacterium]|nr:signal peptidase I [Oscillospiraceae bacterium]
MEENQQAVQPGETTAHNIYYWLQTLVVAVVTIVLLFGFVCRITRVEGGSMLDTLHDGDLLLLWSLGYTPKAGDVVVLNKTDDATTALLGGEAIVKRVIATGGQTVEINYATDEVYVDGERLEEPYIRERNMNGSGIRTYEVPEGHVFVMGDNRNASTDGRAIGTVDEGYVMGKAVCILFPFSDMGLL